MAEKIEKVTVVIDGSTRVIARRALKMAQQFFGAVLIEEKPIEPPFELMQRPKIDPPKILKPSVKEEPIMTREDVKEPVIIKTRAKKTDEPVKAKPRTRKK